MLTDLVEEFQKYMGPEWLIAAPALMVCTVIFESVYLYCSDVRYYFHIILILHAILPD